MPDSWQFRYNGSNVIQHLQTGHNHRRTVRCRHPLGLKRAAEYSEEEMDAKIEHTPVLTLVDSVRIEELLESVRRLVETQIREADVVLINKVDASTPEKSRRPWTW